MPKWFAFRPTDDAHGILPSPLSIELNSFKIRNCELSKAQLKTIQLHWKRFQLSLITNFNRIEWFNCSKVMNWRRNCVVTLTVSEEQKKMAFTATKTLLFNPFKKPFNCFSTEKNIYKMASLSWHLHPTAELVQSSPHQLTRFNSIQFFDLIKSGNSAPIRRYRRYQRRWWMMRSMDQLISWWRSHVIKTTQFTCRVAKSPLMMG